MKGTFHRTRIKKKIVLNLYGITKDPKEPKQSWERELAAPGSLT